MKKIKHTIFGRFLIIFISVVLSASIPYLAGLAERKYVNFTSQVWKGDFIHTWISGIAAILIDIIFPTMIIFVIYATVKYILTGKQILILIIITTILISCNKTQELKTGNVLAISVPSLDSVVFTKTLYSSFGDSLQDANLPQYNLSFDSVFLKSVVSQHGNNYRLDDYEFNGLDQSYESFLPDYSKTQIWRSKILKADEGYFTGEDSVYGVYVVQSNFHAADTVLLSVVYYLPVKN